jgi:hypothetical protein
MAYSQILKAKYAAPKPSSLAKVARTMPAPPRLSFKPTTRARLHGPTFLDTTGVSDYLQGKSDLAVEQAAWFKTLNRVHLGYCENLHAKCYLNESEALIAIAYNAHAPYCSTGYAAWKRYANRNYTEKYCHRCGQTHATSMNRPLCVECYKANR